MRLMTGRFMKKYILFTLLIVGMSTNWATTTHHTTVKKHTVNKTKRHVVASAHTKRAPSNVTMLLTCNQKMFLR
jgi:hypothetical protein